MVLTLILFLEVHTHVDFFKYRRLPEPTSDRCTWRYYRTTNNAMMEMEGQRNHQSFFLPVPSKPLPRRRFFIKPFRMKADWVFIHKLSECWTKKTKYAISCLSGVTVLSKTIKALYKSIYFVPHLWINDIINLHLLNM